MATSKKSPSRRKAIAAEKSPARKKSSTSAARSSAGSAPAGASGAEASSRVRVEADGSLRAPVPAPVMRRMGAEEGDNLYFRQLTPPEAKLLGVRSGSYVMSYKREGKR